MQLGDGRQLANDERGKVFPKVNTVIALFGDLDIRVLKNGTEFFIFCCRYCYLRYGTDCRHSRSVLFQIALEISLNGFAAEHRSDNILVFYIVKTY